MEARWINARCGIQTRSARKRLLWTNGETKPANPHTNRGAPPAKLMLNVSPPTGSAEANPFGAFTDYSYVVSSSSKKRNTPLYEGTHVWFQTDISKPFNYTVVKVAEHITDTLYALKEVATSEN